MSHVASQPIRVQSCVMMNQDSSADVSALPIAPIRELGYEHLHKGQVLQALEEIISGHGSKNVGSAAARSIVEDFSGIWPTNAFREAFLISGAAVHFGEALSARIRQGEFSLEEQHAIHMIGSSLVPKPWVHADSSRVANVIFQMLILETRLAFEQKAWKSLDDIYRVADAHGNQERFRESVHIGGRRVIGLPSIPMPGRSLRVNIELLRSNYVDRLKQAAACLGILAVAGLHVSAKATMSDLYPQGTTGRRLCIYAPTCSLLQYVDAMERTGFGEGEMRFGNSEVMRGLAHTEGAVLLPEYVSIRTNREGEPSSGAQVAEMLDIVASSNLRHVVVSP